MDIKYFIADKLFSKELDEAYAMGIREGANVMHKDILFNLKTARLNMTKTRKEGFAKAIELVEEHR